MEYSLIPIFVHFRTKYPNEEKSQTSWSRRTDNAGNFSCFASISTFLGTNFCSEFCRWHSKNDIFNWFFILGNWFMHTNNIEFELAVYRIGVFYAVVVYCSSSSSSSPSSFSVCFFSLEIWYDRFSIEPSKLDEKMAAAAVVVWWFVILLMNNTYQVWNAGHKKSDY